MAECPVCHVDDPELDDYPAPDESGAYVCVDCGYLADDIMERERMTEEASGS